MKDGYKNARLQRLPPSMEGAEVYAKERLHDFAETYTGGKLEDFTGQVCTSPESVPPENAFRLGIQDKPPRVEVTWMDAWSDTIRFEKEMADLLPPVVRQSLGYLVKDDEDIVVLSAELIDNAFTGALLFEGQHIILKSMIERIEYL